MLPLRSGPPLTALQPYAIVTANDWCFSLSDSALRMLVVFPFHALGYSTLKIVLMFRSHEFFGILTNLHGGWLGTRFGLRITLSTGTLMQVGPLPMLIPVADSWPIWWSVAYVVVAQTRSGIAKDRNTMIVKSAFKGVGFFLGGLVLIGINTAVAVTAGGLFLTFLLALVLPGESVRMKRKPAFTALLCRCRGIHGIALACSSSSAPARSGSWWLCRWPAGLPVGLCPAGGAGRSASTQLRLPAPPRQGPPQTRLQPQPIH